MNYQNVLDFWFHELTESAWWSKDDELDQLITKRFGRVHAAACAAELWKWRREPAGRLAEIVVLDQFSRNIFRGSARAFANDAMALALSQEAVSVGADQSLDALPRAFLYMPFMHSESAHIHAEAVRLYAQPGLEKNLEFERQHKVIIDRFGRYPHRNDVLGRASTPEEIEFLTQPNSSF
ncbi:MAG: DUF924 family protein [Pseudomonadota bacterium]